MKGPTTLGKAPTSVVMTFTVQSVLALMKRLKSSGSPKEVKKALIARFRTLAMKKSGIEALAEWRALEADLKAAVGRE